MRTTRITPEAMGWDTKSHAWNDVEFFEDAAHVDPSKTVLPGMPWSWKEAVELHKSYVSPEYSWLNAATSHVETSAQRLNKMEAQMGETEYNPIWRVYVSTPDGVERYDTTGIPAWNMPVSTTGTATQTISFYELTPEELTTEKPMQEKDADEWEPATDEELNDMLGAE